MAYYVYIFLETQEPDQTYRFYSLKNVQISNNFIEISGNIIIEQPNASTVFLKGFCSVTYNLFALCTWSLERRCSFCFVSP